MASVPDFIRVYPQNKSTNRQTKGVWLDKHDLFVPVSGEARLALKKLNCPVAIQPGWECRSNLKPEKTDAQ